MSRRLRCAADLRSDGHEKYSAYVTTSGKFAFTGSLAGANCTACRAGHYDFCMTGNYREHGIKDLDGFMTEFVVEDRHNLHPVARELRDVAVFDDKLGHE